MKNIYHVHPYWIMKQLDRRNQVLYYELEELKKKYNNLNEVHSKLLTKYSLKKKQIEELSIKYHDLQNRKQVQLDKEIEAIKKGNETVAKENRRLKEKNTKLATTNFELRAEIKKLKQKLDDTNKSIFTNLKEKIFK